jgi:hypothetical protein
MTASGAKRARRSETMSVFIAVAAGKELQEYRSYRSYR